MFTALARFDIRFRWLIVALWVVGVLAAVVGLPSLDTVTQASPAQFLAATSPSVLAGDLAAPFRNQTPAGTALIVAYRAGGPLTPADRAALDQVAQAARQIPGVALVTAAGTSPDGQVAEALVSVPATTASSGPAAQAVVNGIRTRFPGAGGSGLSFHLAGPLAASVDAANTGSTAAGNITRFTLLFVIVLLFLVYRAVLAPLITLLPAALAVALAGPLIAVAAQAGLAVASIVQQLLIVLLLGAGADYGLFLCFRVREERARGAAPQEALVTAVVRVGEAITYSALTVAAALLTLLLAPFGLYRGLGPALAIGIGVLLAASLTLTPALVAIFGRAVFWPVPPQPGPPSPGIWGRVAARVVQHPWGMLALGVILFGGLTAGLLDYRTGGLTSSAPASSDSATGAAVLAVHFPRATGGANQVLLRFPAPVWTTPDVLTQAQAQLAADSLFRSITGPLGSGRGALTATQLVNLHATLGPAAALPPVPPAGQAVEPSLYAAYRATAPFISPDGRTVQYYAGLAAGPTGSTAAAAAIPAATATLAAVARTTGATAYGIAGPDATAYDINAASTTSLEVVVPAVLGLILILLALLLRSLVAPWYLALTVGLSYLAALGFAMIVFVHLGSSDGLIFALPLLMFVFAMALGEDYNILIMSRIREEAHTTASLAEALTRAIGITGGTITAAGMILAGTFVVLGVAGGRSDAQQLGFSIAFGVLLDTFFVRTLLIPALALLLGRWNWWPSALSRPPASGPPPAPPGRAAGPGTDPAVPAAGSPP